MSTEDQRRGIWTTSDDGEQQWQPTSRQLRRNAYRELVGHCTRNGAMVAASGLSRAERRRRAREI